MPAHTKIQNETEAVRWIEEGKTYQWIVDEYRRRYGIETTLTMWSNFRRRRGLERRITRDHDLIPWEISPEHRTNYTLAMLRAEARRRAGVDLRDSDAHRLNAWLGDLNRLGAVVHYEPDTEQGFFLVPRTELDPDLIRTPRPGARLSRRRNPDVR